MENLILSANSDRMSSVEIAELTGKQHAHIMRDIRALLEQGINESNFGLVEYTDKKGEKRPCFNLTKKGCLILASGYDAKLRERIIDRWEELETKTRTPLTPAEMLLQQCQMLVEQERRVAQIEENQRIIEEKVAVIDAKTQTSPSYFTVVGYATLNGIDVSIKLASSIGRKAASLCKKRGIPTEKIRDPRFGRVKTYPESILKEVFDQPLTRNVVKF